MRQKHFPMRLMVENFLELIEDTNPHILAEQM